MESIPSENQRFKDWMERHNRNASSVAKSIGVSRAVLSHILSGRNRLSLSIVQNAARTYPDFNLEYIVLGLHGNTLPNEPGRHQSPPIFRDQEKPLDPEAALNSDYEQLILVRNGRFQVLLPEGC